MYYQYRGQTLNEGAEAGEQAHRTAAVWKANQTSCPRQSLSHLEMPIRETCTVQVVPLCNATLHCCIFWLTYYAGSHKVVYSLILDNQHTLLELLESMYPIQSKIPRVL